jgi:hypothetical protein
MDAVNTSAPIDQLAHIRELAPDSPFNNGLVTLGIAANAFTAEIIETAQFVLFPMYDSGARLIIYRQKSFNQRGHYSLCGRPVPREPQRDKPNQRPYSRPGTDIEL